MKMNILFSLCSIIISFFTGTAVGCLFTSLVECVTHIKKRHFRFSYICVSLTFAVIAATVCFFIKPDFRGIVSFYKSDWVFHAVICGIGFICGIIPQFFIPLFVFVYALFFGVSDIQMLKVFGSQYKTARACVNTNEVILQDKRFSVPENFTKIKITYSVYRMNKRYYLLQDRDWLYVSKVTAVDSNGNSVDCNAEKSVEQILSSYKYTQHFISSEGEISVELPSVYFYPAYFTIDREIYGEGIELKVNRYF